GQQAKAFFQRQFVFTVVVFIHFTPIATSVSPQCGEDVLLRHGFHGVRSDHNSAKWKAWIGINRNHPQASAKENYATWARNLGTDCAENKATRKVARTTPRNEPGNACHAGCFWLCSKNDLPGSRRATHSPVRLVHEGIVIPHASDQCAFSAKARLGRDLAQN